MTYHRVHFHRHQFLRDVSMNCLTADRLRQLLNYDPESGDWTHKISRNGVFAGSAAGTPSADGYLNISVDGVVYRAHRLAWLYMTGDWPPSWLDHEDTDRANCKWKNLRPATPSQNIANSRKYSNNTSGYKGVSWNKRVGKWRAAIGKDGKDCHLGYFDHAIDASTAYQQAASEMFGEFARAS